MHRSAMCCERVEWLFLPGIGVDRGKIQQHHHQQRSGLSIDPWGDPVQSTKCGIWFTVSG